MGKGRDLLVSQTRQLPQAGRCKLSRMDQGFDLMLYPEMKSWESTAANEGL